MVVGFCVKCKKKREMKSLTHTKTSRGVPMIKGICTQCNTKMCKLGS